MKLSPLKLCNSGKNKVDFGKNIDNSGKNKVDFGKNIDNSGKIDLIPEKYLVIPEKLFNHIKNRMRS
jgi:hypothetical protein